ncbi:phosphotransferase [Actinosynnema sp. NPDC050436]|uniref:phosphotransferase n=1 Tax=Actinosynnema sp. NPDC050436 TaxID=3155659 RepID=UPI0033D3FFB8
MNAHLAAEPAGDPDAVFRNFQRHNLGRAAEHFDLTITGTPLFGWRLRSISAPVTGRGSDCWLRVVSEEPRWARGDGWTGNADANDLDDIPKPRMLDSCEWAEGDWRIQRAEVLTRVAGEPCSATDVLRTVPSLSEGRWSELRRSFDILSTAPATRTYADQDRVTDRITARFGTSVDTTVTQWATVHGDIHWSNLMRPALAIVDWELWGRGPAGVDAASLLCHSLPVSEVADEVRSRFADVLDTPTGRVAQLYVAARLLRRIDGGDYPDLAAPLHRHTRTLLHTP